MLTADFDFELPRELIAQAPVARGTSRLLVLRRDSGAIEHRRFTDLPELLDPRDLLLLNDTRVIPARVFARRPTGRRFELLLLRRFGDTVWETLLRPSSRAREDEVLHFADGGRVVLRSSLGEGRWEVECDPPLDLERLEDLGEPPLPPYIVRPDGATAADRTDYQTVYAETPGAVAAPTAGLHFTTEILDRVSERGVEIVHLTLHVGIGTFRPVAVDRVADHVMDRECYTFSAEVAQRINAVREAGGRIVCVGTTSVRALEGALGAGAGVVRPGEADTDLFITPGYRFQGTGAMVTNFHLPRSTLLMLVSAFAGRERILEVYRQAVESKYRFFSYGDAMLIL